jgi:hypothetical protein
MPSDELQHSGYLYGTGDPHPRVGPKDKWHWRAQDGVKIAYWSLYAGTKEMGLHIFPIHEAQDWPDLLNQMLTGLNNED